MRNVVTAIVIALLAGVAPAKAMAKGKRQQQGAPKAEDQAKKKAAEEAYKNALKSIPGSNEKLDPWKSMR
jgi:ribosomal protein L12E/L44/L45/RPP1/RPP2